MTFSDLATPRGSVSLERAEKAATTSSSRSSIAPVEELKPIGIINEQNTCFLNSTFQALSATGPLIALLASTGDSSLYPASSSLLPTPPVPAQCIPSNQPAAAEPPLYDLLPVTHAFTASLQRAWRAKDAGGGTYGADEMSSKRSMSLRNLLRELASKYEQYDDYQQQDAHELLRHLLDSMEMEERDVIKQLQPEALDQLAAEANGKKRGSHSHGYKPKQASVLGGQADMVASPRMSPLASPTTSQPPSPTRQLADPLATQIPSQTSLASTGTAASKVDDGMSSGERLIPFVDALFGGSLASVVVCEHCKSVSHTYEGFMDISLSLKNDGPKARKRDRFKAIFRPSSGKKSTSDSHSSLNAVMSDTEMSDSEKPREANRRSSFDQDERFSDGGEVHRSGSLKAFSGLKSKASFSFGKKKDKPKSRQGSMSSANSIPPPPPPVVPGPGPGPGHEHDYAPSTTSSAPNSPRLTPVHSNLSHLSQSSHSHSHVGGPTPAQAAYIARLLAPPPGHQTHDLDPLAKLRAANGGEGLNVNINNSAAASPESGLEEALRAFTSVEILEGENAFACKRCYRMKTGKGKYKGMSGRQATVAEEDESLMDGESLHHNDLTSTSSQGQVPLPAIAIASSSDVSLTASSSASEPQRLGRASSVASRSSASTSIRAPSPLRQRADLYDAQQGMANLDINHNYNNPPQPPAASSNTHIIAPVPIPYDNALSHIVERENGLSHPEPVVVKSGEDADSGSDGLSDTDTSDEEAPPATGPTHPVRPKPTRRQSSHFVMRRAFKRYLFAKSPEVLIFHFKRFRQTTKNMVFTSFYDLKKMDDFVSFPEILDLAPYMAPNRNDYKTHQKPLGTRAPYMDWRNPEQGPELQPVKYRLYAVVVHLGTMIGGHYIAYCLVDPGKMFSNEPSPTGREDTNHGKKDRRVWCFCSDTSIRLASIEEVLSARAYLCFYERVH